MKKLLASRCASSAETLLLCLIFIALPLFEAPKNIFTVLFCAVWIANSFKSRAFGSPTPFDLQLCVLVGVLWISPFTSTLAGSISVGSGARWTLVGLCAIFASKLSYSERQLTFIWACLLVGGAMATLESFVVWSQNGSMYPEFRSVGHVNHSAMYVFVVVAAALPGVLTNNRPLVFAGFLAFLLGMAYLLPSKSGVALLTIAFIVAVFFWLTTRRVLSEKLSILVGLCAVTSVFLFVVLFGPGLWEEFSSRLFDVNPTNGRYQYLQIAIEVYGRNPVFGTGFFSFGQATSENILISTMQISGADLDLKYAGHPHGHSLLATLLVERGIIGVSAAFALLAAYIFYFGSMVIKDPYEDRLLNSAAMAAFLVAIGFLIGGMGNTTMLNEHGHAGMTFIAVVYGYIHQKRALVG